MGSSRLPGKILLPLLEKPILQIEIERMRKCNKVDEIVVITTKQPRDDSIVDLCEELSCRWYRGSESDLLDRHYKASKELGAEIVLKMPSDSPFMDPELVDQGISLMEEMQSDYVSNYHPPSFPDGMDVEVFSFDALEEAWRLATECFQREHTTPFIWDQPEKFKIGNFKNPYGKMFMTHRWTLDYPDDYSMIQALTSKVKDTYACYETLLRAYEESEEIRKINAHLSGVNWYRNCPERLRTITNDLYRNEPI